jgi:hypothetical protein
MFVRRRARCVWVKIMLMLELMLRKSVQSEWCDRRALYRRRGVFAVIADHAPTPGCGYGCERMRKAHAPGSCFTHRGPRRAHAAEELRSPEAAKGGTRRKLAFQRAGADCGWELRRARQARGRLPSACAVGRDAGGKSQAAGIAGTSGGAGVSCLLSATAAARVSWGARGWSMASRRRSVHRPVCCMYQRRADCRLLAATDIAIS